MFTASRAGAPPSRTHNTFARHVPRATGALKMCWPNLHQKGSGRRQISAALFRTGMQTAAQSLGMLCSATHSFVSVSVVLHRSLRSMRTSAGPSTAVSLISRGTSFDPSNKS